MRIVLTGGGTGGHVIPNIAVIDELRERGDHELLYVGSVRGPERAMIERVGVRFEGVMCGKLRRYFSLENVKDAFRIPRGVWQARRVLRELGADVVFSVGGYVSFPVVMAAKMLGLRIILHELDSTMGLANKMSSRFASEVLLSSDIGNIVRSSVLKGSADAGRKFTGLDKHRPVILVMGGSQGALQVNRLIRENLNEILKKFQVVHICGRGKLDIGVKKRGYVQYEYLDAQLRDVYAMTELVVTRGGANSLAEIAALKKKALVIPIGSGSRGDQAENARIFAGRMGWSVLSGKFSDEDFLSAMRMACDGKISGKFINSLGKIVDVILKK